MKTLHFVENVKHLDNKTIALLLYIPKNISDWENDNKDFKWFVKTEVLTRQAETIREGAYVYSVGQGNGYISASEDERVLRIIDRSDRLLNILHQRLQNEYVFSYKNINTLYSYHINVGHGNHSLIVFNSNKFHIWMVDCSDYDFVSHRYYQDNIKKCLKHIQDKFGLKNMHIEAVMLTHPHYDHYSGISYYIDNGMIDRESIFYINLKCNIKSHNFNNLLTKIDTLGSPIIEPFSCNSGGNIQILYPDKPTFTKQHLSLNNMSSVYNICFDDVSYFVFPGDLETKGWNLMKTKACFPNMRDTRYYAISHHGSINGHLRDVPCRRGMTCIKDCLSPTTVPVLMGRNKAFPGIYSEKVFRDFAGRILYFERCSVHNPVSFIEIDLLTSTHKWY